MPFLVFVGWVDARKPNIPHSAFHNVVLALEVIDEICFLHISKNKIRVIFAYYKQNEVQKISNMIKGNPRQLILLLGCAVA